jgi:hypothetical protein
MTSTHRRSGSALLWAILLIAIIATVSAVTAPALLYGNDRQRVMDTYEMLEQVDSGIIAFEVVVKTGAAGTTVVFPGYLHQLSTNVLVGELNSCGTGATMSNQARTVWSTRGPFITYYAPSSGLNTPMGVLNDRVEHASSGAAMYIRIPAAEAALVTIMDQLVDGGDGGAAGKILFGAASNTGTVDLRYRIGAPPAFTLQNKC